MAASPPIDEMKCAQNIPPEVFRQGRLIYFALAQANAADHWNHERDKLIERAAQYLADFHGYSQAGARFCFEVEIQASIRAWLRGTSRYESSVTE